MKLKKVLAVFMSVSLFLGMTACGGPSNGSDGNKGNNGNVSTNSSDYDWTGGADASGGNVTLNCVTWRINDKEYHDEIIRRFEEKYDWITVNMKYTSNTSAYYSNLQADLSFGEGIDCYDVHPGYISTYVDNGVAVPQSDFSYVDNLKEQMLEMVSIDGVCYGYPHAYNFLGFEYNVDIFDSLGLSAPKTPEELVDVVKKLKGAGYGGISYSGNAKGNSLAKNVLLATMGYDAFSEMVTAIDNGTLLDISDVEGVQETIDTLMYFVDNDIFYTSYEGITFDAGLSLFAQKKAAIMYEGTWIINEGDAYFPGLNVSFFPTPVSEDATCYYAEGAMTTMINAGSLNLGAAKLWVEFLADPEISEYYCNASGMTPSQKDIPMTYSWAPEGFDVDFVLSTSSLNLEYADYWEISFWKIFRNALFGGNDYKTDLANFADELKTLDLANK